MTPKDDDHTMPKRAGSQTGRVLPLVLIAALLAVFFALNLQSYLTLDALAENQARLREAAADRPVLSIGAFMLIYAGAVAISVPGAGFLSIFAGFLFGVVTGTIAVVIAATVGSVVIFLAARGAFADTLRAKTGGLAERMRRGFEEDAFSYLFVLRLIPLFPFFAINIAAGLTGMRLRPYVLATGFGIIPGSLVYVSIGNGLRAGIAAGAEESLSGALLQPAVLWPIAGLVLLALLPVAYKRLRGRRPETE